MKDKCIHVLNVWGNSQLSATLAYLNSYISEYRLPIMIDEDISYDKGIFLFKSYDQKLHIQNVSWSENGKSKKTYEFSELEIFVKTVYESCKCSFKEIEIGKYFARLNEYGNPESGLCQKIGYGKMYNNTDGYIDTAFHKFNPLDDSVTVLKQINI